MTVPENAEALHYGHRVGTDEDGETYWLQGHVADRRAIAACNRFARLVCGLADLYDGARWHTDGPTVVRVWLRPDPVRSCYGCGKPVTACRYMGGDGPYPYCCDAENCAHPDAHEWLVPAAEGEEGAQPWTRLDP